MEHIYAFTDEYGAFGWDIDNPTVSTHFIITSIIVSDSNLETCRKRIEIVRKKHFKDSEIKSSKIKGNHKRREKILKDLQDIPYKIFSVCIDKQACKENMSSKGIQFKHSFYKFMNNIVHNELRKAFQKLTIVADEIGTNEYMESFCEYVDARQDIPSLLGETNFSFENSKNDVMIQLADLISGTLAYVYDKHKQNKANPNYIKVLENKIIRIEQYPKTFNNYTVSDSALASEYDFEIANLCYTQAVKFINKYEDSDDSDTQAQIIILKYLLFRFMNNDTRTYIFTKELIHQLDGTTFSNISIQGFRLKVIGRLRDKGVIIASSNKGYKIPSKKSEIIDFINHDAGIVIPMLARLKKCRDLVKLATVDKLDVLSTEEYSDLKQFFDLQDKKATKFY